MAPVFISAVVLFWVSYSQGEAETTDAPAASAQVASTSQPAPEGRGEFYYDAKYDFGIWGPKGWFMTPGDGTKPTRVIFGKSGSLEKVHYPCLLAVIDEIREEQKFQNALEFSLVVLPAYQASAEKSNAEFKLLEPPHTIEVHGIKGARFIYEVRDKDGKKAMRGIDCKFMKDNLVVSLQGTDYPESFDSHIKEFEEVINSFEFIKKEEIEKARSAPPGSSGALESWIEHILSTGEKVGEVYINKEPYFSLGVPREAKRKWCFVAFKNPGAPFCIIDENADKKKGTPFISATLGQLREADKAKSKEEIYKAIVAKHEQREKEMGFQGQRFLKDGAPVDIKGLQAFERLYEVKEYGMDVTYHLLYVFLDASVLVIMLNTETADFEKDDADFMSIVKTLHARKE
jgi:hypothetical protein